MKNSNRKAVSGFTILELLVVTVVIGILVAITVVLYLGINNSAITATLKSDLSNAKGEIIMFHAEKARYPGRVDDCPTPSSDNLCLKYSGSTIFLSYVVDNNAYPKTFSLSIKNVYLSGTITNSTNPVIIETGPLKTIAAITGTARVGSTLTAGVLDPPAATVTYQWQTSSTSNGTYTDIVGATSKTYNPVGSDWRKFIKVSATGIGEFFGTVTSTATVAVTDPDWIAGSGTLSGKYIRPYYMVYNLTWGPSSNCATPQCNSGILSSSNTVDFVTISYPARQACKTIGARLPSAQEMMTIAQTMSAYDGYSWTANENNSTTALVVQVVSGYYGTDYYQTSLAKTSMAWVRCIAD